MDPAYCLKRFKTDRCERWNQSAGWGYCNLMCRIISPMCPRPLRHLPGIPQGISHSHCLPCHTPLDPSFSVWVQHSCNPPFLPPSPPSPFAFSKDAKENKDEAEEPLKTAPLGRNPSSLELLSIYVHCEKAEKIKSTSWFLGSYLNRYQLWKEFPREEGPVA